MSLVGRVFSNRYEIQRELAQGGMAEVYLARDLLLDRPVALKALFPEYAREPSFVERFRREAQAAANLNHPNIVAIYDWGQEGGTYYIVMEYVEGRSLRDLIRGEGPIPAAQAADICAEIAAGLAFAHRSGVVHRDVKPGNVLITRSGNVKISDFGIARAGAADGLTQTGSVMGTATYFSPEQAQGLPVDGRSDVYSLGVVLYEVVTGVAPFTGDSPVAVAYKHVREEPVPPTRRNPDVPEDVEQVILTAMAKDPDLRYQSADDMRADLLRFRRGRPLAAAPVTALVAEVPDEAAAAMAGATVATPRVGATDATSVGPAVVPRGRGRRALFGTLTFLLLALIVGGIFVISQVAGKDVDKVEVPGVIGDDVEEARKRLEDEGFEVKIEEVANEEVPEGQVIDQRPRGGSLLKKGGEVTLTVSAGAGEVKIPPVAGKLADDAQQILEDLGLKVEVEAEQNDVAPLFTVLRTEPPEGETVPDGSTVTLVISGGPELVKVPDVSDLSEAEATLLLEAEGFRVLVVSEASEEVPEGEVIRTEPLGDAEAPKSSTVRLYVSSGPQKILVPQVQGKTEADARAEIEAAGLTPSVTYAESVEGNDGLVISMDPAANSEQLPGTTILLTVGTFNPPTTESSTTTSPSTTTSTTATTTAP